MSTKLMECEAQALQLPLAKRAELAEHLIASLDNIDEVQNEQLWINEADRRYNEYKKGNMSARCAEDVLGDARARIK